MNTELENKLIKKYPKIFIDANKSPQESCMYWGLEVGDGWYDLIDVLCEALTYVYTTSVKIDEEDGKRLGIEGYAFKGGTDMNYFFKVNPPQVVADQVKEKFGGLRFYVQAATSKHYDYISFAESMSYRTCEQCGAPGKRYSMGWHKTLCDIHADMDGRNDDVEDGDE